MALDSGLLEMEFRGDELEGSVPVFQSRPPSKLTNLHHLPRERHRSPGACENAGFRAPPPHPHPPFQILLQKVEDRAQETCISGKFPGGAEAVGPGTPLENHGSEELADRCLTRSGEACLRYLCFSWPQTRHLPTLNLFPTWKLNIIIPALLPAQVCTCSRCMGGK